MAPSTAPNPLNYFVGRGNVYTKVVDADNSTYAHLGNCPKFAVRPTSDVMTHFASTTAGARVEDFAALNTKSLQVSIAADEMHAETLMLGLGATNVGSGVYRVQTDLIFRAIKLVGNNSVGAPVQLILPKVLITTEEDIEFIGDEFLQFPITGKALYYPKTAAGSDYTFMDATFV